MASPTRLSGSDVQVKGTEVEIFPATRVDPGTSLVHCVIKRATTEDKTYLADPVTIFVQLWNSLDGKTWNRDIGFTTDGGILADEVSEIIESWIASRCYDDNTQYKVTCTYTGAKQQKIKCDLIFEKGIRYETARHNSVTIEDEDSADFSTVSSVTSPALTESGSDVAVAININVNNAAITGVKYNGSTGQDVTDNVGTSHANGGTTSYSYVYYDLAPTTGGVATFYVTFGNSQAKGSYTSRFLNTVDSVGDSFATAFTAIDASISSTLTSTASGDLVLASLCAYDSQGYFIDAEGQSPLVDDNLYTIGGTYIQSHGFPSGSTFAVDYDFTGYDPSYLSYYDTEGVFVGVVFKEATGGASNVLEPVPAGQLTLTGIAPATFNTTPKSEAIPAGQLTLTGIAPDSTRVGYANPVPASNITLTGFAPGINRVGYKEPIPSGALTLNAFAPGITRVGYKEVIPAGQLTLTGVAPGFVNHTAGAEPVPVGQLTLTGYAPDISILSDVFEPVPASSLNLTSFAPGFTNLKDVSEPVAKGTLRLVSFNPGVFNTSAAAVAEISKPAGSAKRYVQQWRYVIIGNQRYRIHSEWELQELLRDYLQEQQKKLMALKTNRPTPSIKRKLRVIRSNITRTEKRIERIYDDEEEELLMLL